MLSHHSSIVSALRRLSRVGLLSLGLGVAAASAHADPLDPTAFPSLGPNPFTTAGTYTIDASFDNPAPVLYAGATPLVTGVFYDPTPADLANRDEIAVFTFDDLTIPADVTVLGAQNANSRPVALLSHGTLTLDGTLNVSGANGANGFSPAGNGGNAGPGGGGGGGGESLFFAPGNGGLGFVNGGFGGLGTQTGLGIGGSVVVGGGGRPTGGGAFGGNGGTGTYSFGGAAYGDLGLTLQGGSGGGGGVDSSVSTAFQGGGGGGGGGAVELGAVGAITVTGSVRANGGVSGASFFVGGGGAGGGILVHAPTVTLSGALDALGGASQFFRFGGGGGGGRILILTADGTLASGSLDLNVDVSGATIDVRNPGQPGVKELGIGTFNHPPVAQCQNVSINACGGVSVSIDNGSSDPDSGDAITLNQSPAGPYGLGSTLVTLTVTDSHGATNTCTGTVTVADQSAPTISCPSNQTATATSGSGAVVSFTPTASDNCGTLLTTCTPASGSTFPIGSTGVTCTATDGAGLQNSCNFTVTVTATALMQTTALIATVDGLPVPPAVKLVLKTPLLVAKVALQNNRPQIACGSLRVFEGIVAQLRQANKLTTAQATQLTTASQSIRTAIGCP